MEIDSFQHRQIAPVFKCNLPELHFATHTRRQLFRIGAFADFNRRIKNIEDPFTGGTRGLEHLVETMKLPDRRVKHSDVCEESDKCTERQFTRQHRPSAEPKNDDVTQPRAEFHRRRVHRPRAHDLKCRGAQFIGFRFEAMKFMIFTAETFDLADSLQIVEQ